MNNTWNLKLFISLSLGLHLFVLFLLSILIPDFKITQLPRLNIEVSLLSIAREERELPRKVEKRVIVRSEKKESLKTVEKREMEIKNESPMSNHEERKISQVEKAEVALPQKELEPIATTPVHHEVKVVSISEPKLSPLANEKKEIENKQEERIVVASLGNPIPSVSSSEKPHTEDDGTIVKTTYGIERIPDPMAFTEMEAYHDDVNVDRLVSLAALIAFAKVQQANRGYKKRVDQVNTNNLQKSDNLYKLNTSPFRHMGKMRKVPGMSFPKSPFKNMR